MDDRFLDQAVRARRWFIAWLAAGLGMTLALLFLSLPLYDYFHGHYPPAAWFGRVAQYAALLKADPKRYVQALLSWWTAGLKADGRPPLLLLLAFLPLLASIVESLRWNPYDWEASGQGNSRPATLRDLQRWARDRVVPYFFFMPKRRTQNLLDASGIILGRFKSGMRRHIIRCGDTLSCLVLAAPGSGKTAGIAVPTILDAGMAAWSMFIYDIKGELYDLTSGFRSRFGPIFRFEPKGTSGARWNPLSHERSLPGGRRYIELLTALESRLGALYAGPGPEIAGLEARKALMTLMRENADWRQSLRDNPGLLGQPLDMGLARSALTGDAAAASIPGASAFRRWLSGRPQPLVQGMADKGSPSICDMAIEMDRILSDIETYLMRLAAGLKPDNPNAGGNKYFDDTGRELLFGWMGFTIFRAFRLGREPNFGLLIDWWAEAARSGAEAADEKGDDGSSGGPNQAALELWIKECEAYGYPKRYEQVLISQRANAEKTLANVVSTADTALNIFKLATVRNRTATSDFALDDIRGMKAADGKSYPVTVYVVVSLEDIKSMAPILMMFTEALQSRLISQSARDVKKARPVLFLLDEFAQIPKMDILLQGPAVGRGQKVANLMIAQSNGQIDQTYGAGGRTTLYDTTEWKVVFPLTSKQTAEEFSAMIGNRTVHQKSHGRRGFDLGALFDKGGGGGVNINTSLGAQPLFSASDLMSTDDGGKMKANEQLIIVRGRANRPIICETPYYFQDKAYAALSRIPFPANQDANGFCGELKALRPRPAEAATPGPQGEPHGKRATAQGGRTTPTTGAGPQQAAGLRRSFGAAKSAPAGEDAA